jgi:hypothetical protein
MIGPPLRSVLFDGADLEADRTEPDQFSDCFHSHLVVAAQALGDKQEQHNAERVSERQHHEDIRVAEILGGNDRSGGGVALCCAEFPTCS